MKKVICLILAIAVIVFSLPSIHVRRQEIKEPVEPTSYEKYSIKCTKEDMHENEWYWDMCSQLLEFETTCTVSARVGNRDVGKAVPNIVDDFPEIFWTGKSYYGTTITDGSEISFSRPDWFEWDDVPEMYDNLVSAADELIKAIPDGADDYEKILFVHDYIIDNTKYDRVAADRGENRLAGTSYGCLVEGSAVCEGYAEAFQYIMNRLGIEGGICNGSNHAWNYVKLDGEYYWVDVTWDDNEATEPEHTFFLVNDDILLRTRSFYTTQGYVPECVSLSENYFVRNGGYFESYDKKSVTDYIGRCVESGRCEIMFADYESYKSAIYGLFRDNHISKVKGVGKYVYYRYDNAYTLDIIFD